MKRKEERRDGGKEKRREEGTIRVSRRILCAAAHPCNLSVLVETGGSRVHGFLVQTIKFNVSLAYIRCFSKKKKYNNNKK